MDNHPIPQDVTHFQFKLVGELTIKQFGYIAAGGVLAWIVFSLPIIFIIKLIFAIIFAGSGLILAFVPFEGRPADLMLSYFFRALFQPNQYLFQKTGSPPTSSDQPSQLTQTYEPQAITNLPAISQSVSAQQTAPAPAPQPARQIPNVPAPNPGVTTPPIPLPPLEAKQHQDVPVTPLNQTPAQPPVMQTVTPVPSPVLPPTPPDQTTATPPVVKQPIAQQPAANTMVASEFPNIIMGIIKDSRGNVLPNILIEVKDTSDNPVRAFKTNALGQFASATPLLNGTYTISFEDSKNIHKFQNISVEAKGEIMQPIQVISVDQREELRKELFG